MPDLSLRVLPDAFIASSLTPAPNRPSVSVTPGLWKLTVAQEIFSGSTVTENRQVLIVMKHLAEQPAENALGTLRLDLFFACGNDDWTVASLGPSPFETGLKKFRDVFQRIGIIPVLGRMEDIENRFNRYGWGEVLGKEQLRPAG